MRAVAGVAAAAILLALAACGGGGSSSYVAKVGSKPITKAQLQAVLAKANTQYQGLDFPVRGSAEYHLAQEQAIDFLVQQSLAHQADAELGIKPEDEVVTDASWRKVTSGIHVSDAQVRAVFEKDPKRYKPEPNRTLDLGTVTEIRSQLLTKERGAAMHRFVTSAEKRWPVTYGPGYRPVSEMALARKVWPAPPKKACDLPAGSYLYAKAWAHGCLSETPIPGMGSPACYLLGPGGDGGFTSAEVHDGYDEYAMDNGDTCTPDPRTTAVQVTPDQSTVTTPPPPVKVSYFHAAGTATYKDPLLNVTLRYPRRFHLHWISYGSLASVDGVEIANYPLADTPPDEGRPSSGPLSPGAVDFLLTDGRGLNGPVSFFKLPLKLTDASLATGSYLAVGTADGLDLDLSIRTGSAPSRRDIRALESIAASIHTAPLRVGHFLPNRLYVLGRASKYPLGSVTQFPASPQSGRFYLEHTPAGFWMVTWPDDYLHGYKACGPHYDAAHRRFTCPNGAIWNLDGKVVTNPDPKTHPDDPLVRQQVLVTEGDVLVSLPQPRS